MLGLRLRDGLPLDRALASRPRAGPPTRSRAGCSTPAAHAAGRAVLTDRGRLLADAVVRDLTD